MIAIIKDYLLTVLVRAIIGYVLFLFFLLVIFAGYIIIADWASAVNFIIELTDNDFAKIVAWLPLVFSLFEADKRASDIDGVKEFHERLSRFFLMFDTTGGKW